MGHSRLQQMHSWFGAYVGVFVWLLNAVGVRSVCASVCFNYSASRNTLPSPSFSGDTSKYIGLVPQGVLEGWTSLLA